MKIVRTPTVEFLVPKQSIPFESEIDIIYRGYRQCYSKNPMAPMRSMDMQEKMEFLSGIAGYMKYHPELNRNLEGADPDAMFDHLRKCDFIFRHMNHQSPLEHSKLTVRITNMSRAASMQLIRHRIAPVLLTAMSQQSQRYVTEKDFPAILPDTITSNPEAFEIVKDTLQYVEDSAVKLKSKGVANEDIRYMFTNATCTDLILTANFREWMHIFNERCCMAAQTEIRMTMYQVLRYLQTHIPLIFDHAGPKCESLGYCPESAERTCGRHITKEELFKQIQLRRIHGKTWVAERNPNVPIPRPVRSLDIDRISACELAHMEERERSERTEIEEQEMSLTLSMHTGHDPLNGPDVVHRRSLAEESDTYAKVDTVVNM